MDRLTTYRNDDQVFFVMPRGWQASHVLARSKRTFPTYIQVVILRETKDLCPNHLPPRQDASLSVQHDKRKRVKKEHRVTGRLEHNELRDHHFVATDSSSSGSLIGDPTED